MPRTTEQHSQLALRVEAIGAQAALDEVFRLIGAGELDAARAAVGEVRTLVNRAIRGEQVLRGQVDSHE